MKLNAGLIATIFFSGETSGEVDDKIILFPKSGGGHEAIEFPGTGGDELILFPDPAP